MAVHQTQQLVYNNKSFIRQIFVLQNLLVDHHILQLPIGCCPLDDPEEIKFTPPDFRYQHSNLLVVDGVGGN